MSYGLGAMAIRCNRFTPCNAKQAAASAAVFGPVGGVAAPAPVPAPTPVPVVKPSILPVAKPIVAPTAILVHPMAITRAEPGTIANGSVGGGPMTVAPSFMPVMQPSGGGATSLAPSAGGETDVIQSDSVPSWMIVAGVGAVALLFLSRKRK